MRLSSRPLHRLVFVLAFFILCFSIFLVWAHRPAIPPIDPPARSSFSAAEIARGAQLATLGNCASCHTRDGGPSYAGGRPMETPFGTLYGANITPDPDTGIGRWSLAAFRRALREGVRRDGAHLYPAFPYDRLSKIDDRDIAALYAFLMTRQPIQAEEPSNRLYPPLGFRPLLAGWKLLFFAPQQFKPDPTKSPEWNRGAYLVEGLAHCASCHSPRNAFGAEKLDNAYGGGEADGWRAPPLNRSTAAVGGWSADDLQQYLLYGVSLRHGAAGGPMGEVTFNMARSPRPDVRAVSVYIASLMGEPRAVKPWGDGDARATASFPQGASLFGGACASCHAPNSRMITEGRPGLEVSTALADDDPRLAIQTLLAGIRPPTGPAGPFMPPFRASLNDADLAALLNYTRMRFAGKAPWPVLERDVATARKQVK
jgi:nicotinate dehydrogenase subunit B